MSDDKKTTAQRKRDARQLRFLDAYAITGVIGEACEASGVPRPTFKQWRQNDEAFAEAVLEAEQEAIDRLRSEAKRRALDGWEEPVIHQGRQMYKRHPLTNELLLDDDFEPIPLTINKKSDRILEKMLEAKAPEYSRKGSLELTGPGGSSLMPTKVEVHFTKPPDWDNVEWGEDGRPILDGQKAED